MGRSRKQLKITAQGFRAHVAPGGSRFSTCPTSSHIFPSAWKAKNRVKQGSRKPPSAMCCPAIGSISNSCTPKGQMTPGVISGSRLFNSIFWPSTHRKGHATSLGPWQSGSPPGVAFRLRPWATMFSRLRLRPISPFSYVGQVVARPEFTEGST